jgi:glycerol uptake facilitator-like aquaporin
MARVALAEAVGTYVLVLSIICVVVATTLSKPIAGSPFGSLAVPLAGGAALGIMVATFGPLSGAHLNPAVTLGLAVNRRFPWSYVPAYILAQLVGAIGAALSVWWFYGNKARSVAQLGAPVPVHGVGVWRVCGIEAVVTFVLLLVIVTVASDRRVNASVAAWSIG